jgi:error-prone DNA polymerase
MTLQRAALDRRGILSSAELDACQDGQTVPVAGLVVVHQSPPTAKGHHFITLEDEEGLIDIVVRPQVYARFQRVIATSRLLFVRGTLQKADGSRSLLARHIAPLSI